MTFTEFLVHVPIYATMLIIGIVVLIIAFFAMFFQKISLLLSDLSRLVNLSNHKPINAYGHKCPIGLKDWPHGYNYLFIDIYDRYLESFEGGNEVIRVYWCKEKPTCIRSEVKSYYEFKANPAIISGPVFALDTYNGAPIHELI